MTEYSPPSKRRCVPSEKMCMATFQEQLLMCPTTAQGSENPQGHLSHLHRWHAGIQPISRAVPFYLSSFIYYWINRCFQVLYAHSQQGQAAALSWPSADRKIKGTWKRKLTGAPQYPLHDGNPLAHSKSLKTIVRKLILYLLDHAWALRCMACILPVRLLTSGRAHCFDA